MKKLVLIILMVAASIMGLFWVSDNDMRPLDIEVILLCVALATAIVAICIWFKNLKNDPMNDDYDDFDDPFYFGI